ncbi:MAG: VOC family protein [Deltaproteobacteria bacterium]|nr:VOC family protein [Deltaproteobacteria bacterium]
MIRLRHLDHFGLHVRDLARAERFYTEVLGMTVQARFGDQVLLRVNDTVLALFEKPELPPPDPAIIQNPLGKGHHAFQVSAEDFEVARRRFREVGIPTHDPIDWGDHDCLYFLDPDGNLLELISYRS